MKDGETRMARGAGIAAILGIVLIAAANIQLGSPPKADAPAREVLAFRSGHRSQALIYAYLFGIGLMLLTWFGAALRLRLRRAGDSSALPDMVLAAAVWIAAADAINVGVTATAAFRAPGLDARTAQVLADFGNVGFALLGIPFAVLFGATAISAMATRALPRWLVWLGALTAILNLLKPITMFARSGALAPNGALTLVPLIPIWVWTIAVGVRMARGVKHPVAQPAQGPSPAPARS